MIDKKSPIPLYAQLERALREKIRNDLAPGELLGTIDSICEAYEVSAITVKHSLGRLMSGGIIKSIKSRGYFVKKTPPVEDKTSFVAFVSYTGERAMLNPMYAKLYEGAYSVLKKNNLLLPIYSSEELISESIYKKPYFYGFIVVGLRNPGFHDALFSSDSRFVIADGLSDFYPSILTDNERGVKMAVEYCLKQGHRRIAFIKGNPEDEIFALRLKGYKDVLSANGIEIRQDLIFDDFKFLQNEKIKNMKKLLTAKDRPTAIFFSSDLLAHFHVPEIKKMGFRIPEDLSVIGFDDQEESYYMDPPLTTIKQPMFEVGRRAAQMLLDMKDDRRSFFSKKSILIKPDLIVRKSCAPPPGV